MSKKKADKKKGGFVRAIRNIFVFLIACALLILLGLTGIYIYVKHDVNPRLLKEEDATFGCGLYYHSWGICKEWRYTESDAAGSIG